MSANIFRIFDPKGTKEDPKERRRGQLRRAQQALRDRRDQYAKSLEQELDRTRANEAKLARQVENLRATIAMLCGQFGVEAPPELRIDTPHQDSTYSSGTSPVNSSTTSRTMVKTQRNTGWGSAEGSDQQSHASTSPWTSSPDSSSDHPGSVNEWPVFDSQHRLVAASSTRNYSRGGSDSTERSLGNSVFLRDLDHVSVGMEFVLTLEEPCLGHLHGDPSKPNEPNGHALTSTAHLFSVCSPRNHSSPNNVNPSAPSYTEAPKATLARLLSLAPDIVPTGDVTPVQAWNHIQSRPFFGGLDVPSLRNLAVRLRDAVKCHGFGAVVQQPVFERLVLETLMLGREF